MPADKRSPAESVSIGIPAYNEERCIAGAVREALEVGRQTGADFEVLVVDDGSRDGTAEILAGLAMHHPQLRVVRHAENRGIGAAMARLCSEASMDLLFLNAADGQWRMTELLPMREAMRDQALDLVIGARIQKRYTPYRRLISVLGRVLCERLFGFELWDPTSIVLLREPVRRIAVGSRGVFAHTERIVRARALGYRAGKVDVEHLPRSSGRGHGASLANILLALRECASFYAEFRTGLSASQAPAPSAHGVGQSRSAASGAPTTRDR